MSLVKLGVGSLIKATTESLTWVFNLSSRSQQVSNQTLKGDFFFFLGGSARELFCQNRELKTENKNQQFFFVNFVFRWQTKVKSDA
jgi:hypothetical protein